MFKKKQTLVRRGNFMTAPEGGWLHDEQALAHGSGIYYSFPVKYVGSLQILESLRALSMEDKTNVCREAIYRCIDSSKVIKPIKRKKKKFMKQYLADAPYVKVMLLRLNVSTDGIATSAVDTPDIISNDPISKISFAAGGDGKAYNFITYVAKDRRDNRYCHVFDCGPLADDLLATLGQVFNILRKKRDGGTMTAPPPLPANHPTAKNAHLCGVAALQAAPKIDEPQDADNVYGEAMYETMATNTAVGEASSSSKSDTLSVPIAREVFKYEDGDDTYEGMEEAMPAPTKAQAMELYAEMYGEVQSGAQLAEFLNDDTRVHSNSLYGEVPEDTVYGDGQVGWSYLSVAPDDDTYGTLADYIAT
ncbi:hypothetical protein PTSG_07105 [Salpingoeca rosetta]|uniref:PID domain-containing protein n=1 Tax=Salpingoeca rosetta (strain ATCC 50818 / BSB-021) TaxID=946362 RepID=F2UE27_SALR5|nr:uncharacterized protein PTSG_07105 [Salpingoeca rosetta]EGD74877.1 hypothetical protein PTSG_07105 [Salpingoeca rosetta]|eukprot:XP_004992522.1 hypothetical protein PTSG_07105 [Salpingoeca rosetta]